MTKRLQSILTLLISILFFLPLCSCALDRAEEPALITKYTMLMAAVQEANDGDVLLVGDVDFSPNSPQIANSYMFIEINKSITIKSGKKDGAALFTNGGFLFVGSKTAGEKISVAFENIIFDGKADYDSLTEKDYEYPWSESDQAYTVPAPLKAQQALSFKGNVDASFSGCVFQNYMHEYGPVIDIRYGDYTGNEYLSQIFPDYSGCRVNLNMNDCRIQNNSALYDGGAVYIESNHNVTLNAENCMFSGNRSATGEFRRGGGAICAIGATLNLTNCTLEKNVANHVFADSTLAEYDTHKGGAILLENGKLRLVNTEIRENRASLGGGLSLTNVNADIDGCRFVGNRAEAHALNPDGLIGPWSNMAMGGAIYAEGNNNDSILLVNCEIQNNSAATAYGGIYGYYSPHEDPSFGTYLLKMNLCTYENNYVDSKYDYNAAEQFPWASHPGDMFANSHLTLFGCYVIDETFRSDFPRQNAPTAENGYNFLSAASDEAIRAFSLPEEAVSTVIGGRYGNKLSAFHIGSNYAESLYAALPSAGEGTLIWWLIGAIVPLLVLLGVIFVIFLRKKAAPEPIPAEPTATVTPPAPAEKKHIVMTRYHDEDIDRFLSLVPETGLLTGRELEVLREILRGKKQSEVAHYLGIEVTTVKDFYKKIYTKLNVENKDKLLIQVSEILKNN